MAQLTVRDALPSDHDAIRELTLSVYIGEELTDGGYAATLADVEHRAVHAELLVADVDGVLVGSVAFARHGSAYAEITRVPDEAAFRMLAVHPQARGHGAGRALVLACMDRARTGGVRRIVISTETGMRAAQRLYYGLGFRREPERDWSPHPGIDLLCYVVDLTEPADTPAG